MNRKQIIWLLDEIEAWSREGVITPAAAVCLKARYETLKKDHRPVALIILGSLGALLIGLGIISLLAANWGGIPRTMRIVIAFTPLVISYGAALGICLKDDSSPVCFEPLGIFWALSIGAGIALVSQTYHLPGDMETFIISWMVLLVPVAWVTRSLGCVAGYYIGLLFWAGYVENKLGTGVLYWPLSALVLPVVISEKRRSPSGVRGIFMFWSLLVSSIIALGMTLDKSVPGLWIVIYVAFFTVMLLFGTLSDSDESGFWTKPLSLCGAGGLAVVLYLLCYEWPWRDVGPSNWRHDYGHYLWVSIIYDFGLTVVLVVAAMILFVLWRRRVAADAGCALPGKVAGTTWYAAPLVTVAAYGLVSCEAVPQEFCALLLTIYLAFAALLTIAEGVGCRILWKVNCGMLLFLAVVIGKFFSQEYSHTLKGIVFIVCGVVFFTGNLIFARRLGKEAHS